MNAYQVTGLCSWHVWYLHACGPDGMPTAVWSPDAVLLHVPLLEVMRIIAQLNWSRGSVSIWESAGLEILGSRRELSPIYAPSKCRGASVQAKSMIDRRTPNPRFPPCTALHRPWMRYHNLQRTVTSASSSSAPCARLPVHYSQSRGCQDSCRSTLVPSVSGHVDEDIENNSHATSLDYRSAHFPRPCMHSATSPELITKRAE